VEVLALVAEVVSGVVLAQDSVVAAAVTDSGLG
jgi:hypothetical protein